MSGIIFESNSLNALIDHHIFLLKKFKITEEAPFSLISFKVKENINKENIVFNKLLKQIDALCYLDNYFVVLLPYTDKEDASKILFEIQSLLNEEKNNAVVTFPTDGDSSEELLNKLSNILEEKYQEKAKILTFSTSFIP